MEDLFAASEPSSTSEKLSGREPSNLPLAARMRPETLDDVLGQDHLVGPGKLLRRTIQSDLLSSILFYGPPGTGKTSLASIISKITQSRFYAVNAVTSNVAELRKIFDQIQAARRQNPKRSILFIDEIHRFNKAQQDSLMPYIEHGDFILIGATTHNPSFVLNAPILSRSLVFELRPIEKKDLAALLQRALKDPVKGLGQLPIELEPNAAEFLVDHAAGDARRLLNSLEVGALTTEPDPDSGRIMINLEVASECCQKQIVRYDHDEDEHYDTISAFIKSIRGSDPDAGVYWLAKMLYAGEDPRFIIRRLLILASEDIGNADPQALILASSALQATEFVGMPESQIILSQLVTYLALAPKSNASYEAINQATEAIKSGLTLEVPDHLRDAHYPQAKGLGHGSGYQYPHSAQDQTNPENPQPKGQNYLSQKLRFYHPKRAGFEATLSDRLAKILSPKQAN